MNVIFEIVALLLSLFMLFYPSMFIDLYKKINPSPIVGPGSKSGYSGKEAFGFGMKYQSSYPTWINPKWVRIFGVILLIFAVLSLVNLV
ncbi:MAG: hypothetical protein Q7R87_01250 [Nanoarchaeota archaeon]|nr:hypothetical protein [Nanoarchaeota archaeon]